MEGELLYPTDSLRTHERFYDNSSSEQAFTAFRMVVEQLLLVNVLRYFFQKRPLHWFDEVAFVMDGPFGHFWDARLAKRPCSSRSSQNS